MRRTLLAASLLAVAVPALAGTPTPRAVVFFESWSAQLNAPARKAIQTAADWAKQHPSESLTVIGYASTIGSKPANDLLSRLRSQIVSDTLVEDGVPPAQIRMQAEGATPYVLDPTEARRVEIALGGP